MKIGIDIRVLSRASATGDVGGLGVYAEHLVQNLARIDDRNQYYLYADREYDASGMVNQPNFVVRPVGPKNSLLRENLTLPYQMMRDRIDMAHFPINSAPLWYTGKHVVTIHDTATSLYGRFGWEGLSRRLKLRILYESRVSPWIAGRATRIITDSKHSREDISSIFGVRKDKIQVIYAAPGCIPRLLRGTDSPGDSLIRTIRGKKFILSVGSSEPRKNLKGLIRAFAHFVQEHQLPHHLVIVSSDGASKAQLVNEVGAQIPDERVIVLPRVSAPELQGLYALAELFVFPSLYEGFGMPPLEAMAAGTPVVSSNQSSLPEVLGEAAILADPRDPGEMAAKIYQVLTDEALRDRLIEMGLRQAARFSWEKTAREVLAVYEEVYLASNYLKPRNQGGAIP